jgi:hypothetical protein
MGGLCVKGEKDKPLERGSKSYLRAENLRSQFIQNPTVSNYNDTITAYTKAIGAFAEAGAEVDEDLGAAIVNHGKTLLKLGEFYAMVAEQLSHWPSLAIELPTKAELWQYSETQYTTAQQLNYGRHNGPQAEARAALNKLVEQRAKAQTSVAAYTPELRARFFTASNTPVEIAAYPGVLQVQSISALLEYYNHSVQYYLPEHDSERLLELVFTTLDLAKQELVLDEAELLSLATISGLHEEKVTRALLTILTERLRDSVFLDATVLRALAVALRHADFLHLTSNMLIEILRILMQKLEKLHLQADNLRLFSGMVAALQMLLRSMADIGVAGLPREELHDKLYDKLSSLLKNEHHLLQAPQLRMLMLAQEALLHIPDDESNLQSFLRRTGLVVSGIASLATAVLKHKPASFLEACKKFYEAYKHQKKPAPWYDEWHYLCLLLDTGHYVGFEELLFASKFLQARYLEQGGDCEEQQQYLESVIDVIIVHFQLLATSPAEAAQAANVSAAALLDKLSEILNTANPARQYHWQRQATLLHELHMLPPSLQAVSSSSGLLLRASALQVHKASSWHLCLWQNRRIKDQYIERALELYIPTTGLEQAQARQEQRFDLFRDVDQWLANPQQPLYLLTGGSGSGKSLFAALLEDYLLRQGKYLPLLVSLPTLRKAQGNLLSEVLQRKGLLQQWQSTRLYLQRQKIKIVLICDGYDELNISANLITANQAELNQYCGRLGHDYQVMITCRYEYLSGNIDYRQLFVPINEYGMAEEKLLRTRHVAPFSASDANAFLERYIISRRSAWRLEQYLAYLAQHSTLQELSSAPFSLYILAEVLPALVAQQPNTEQAGALTRRALFLAFLRGYLQRQLNKDNWQQPAYNNFLGGTVPKKLQALEEFSVRLALSLYNADKQTFYYSLDDLVASQLFLLCLQNSSVKHHFSLPQNYSDSLYAIDNSTRDKMSLFINTLPLQVMGPEVFGFLHKSLFESLVAQGLGQEISCSINLGASSPTHAAASPATQLLTSLNQRLLNKEPSILQFMVEQLQSGGTEVENQYWNILELSKRDAGVTVAAANAATILNLARVSFSNRDLSNVKIDGAELYGVISDSTNWKKASMRGVDLRHAYLSYSCFDGADMRGVITGEIARFRNNEWTYVYGIHGQKTVPAFQDCYAKYFLMHQYGEIEEDGEQYIQYYYNIHSTSNPEKVLHMLDIERVESVLCFSNSNFILISFCDTSLPSLVVNMETGEMLDAEFEAMAYDGKQDKSGCFMALINIPQEYMPNLGGLSCNYMDVLELRDKNKIMFYATGISNGINKKDINGFSCNFDENATIYDSRLKEYNNTIFYVTYSIEDSSWIDVWEYKRRIKRISYCKRPRKNLTAKLNFQCSMLSYVLFKSMEDENGCLEIHNIHSSQEVTSGIDDVFRNVGFNDKGNFAICRAMYAFYILDVNNGALLYTYDKTQYTDYVFLSNDILCITSPFMVNLMRISELKPPLLPILGDNMEFFHSQTTRNDKEVCGNDISQCDEKSANMLCQTPCYDKYLEKYRDCFSPKINKTGTILICFNVDKPQCMPHHPGGVCIFDLTEPADKEGNYIPYVFRMSFWGLRLSYYGGSDDVFYTLPDEAGISVNKWQIRRIPGKGLTLHLLMDPHPSELIIYGASFEGTLTDAGAKILLEINEEAKKPTRLRMV